MNNKLDPDTLKIPAYMRKKMIISQARQKLILTALDRKEAGLKHDSKKAVAKPKKTISRTPRTIPRSAPSQLSFGELSGSFARIGVTTHYLDKISVAVIKLSAPLKIGEKVLIQGSDEIFIQSVDEVQIDRKPVKKASKGSHIGMKVNSPAIINGFIYRLPA